MIFICWTSTWHSSLPPCHGIHFDLSATTWGWYVDVNRLGIVQSWKQIWSKFWYLYLCLCFQNYVPLLLALFLFVSLFYLYPSKPLPLFFSVAVADAHGSRWVTYGPALADYGNSITGPTSGIYPESAFILNTTVPLNGARLRNFSFILSADSGWGVIFEGIGISLFLYWYFLTQLLPDCCLHCYSIDTTFLLHCYHVVRKQCN